MLHSSRMISFAVGPDKDANGGSYTQDLTQDKGLVPWSFLPVNDLVAAGTTGRRFVVEIYQMDCLENHSDVHTKLERCAFVAFLQQGKTTVDGPRVKNADRSSFEGTPKMDVLYVLHNIAGFERALESGTDQECMMERNKEGKVDDAGAQVGGLVAIASHENENPFQLKREYYPFHEAFVAIDQTSHCRLDWNWNWNLQTEKGH